MRLEQILPLMRALPLFANIGAETLRLIAFSAQNRAYRPGEALFRRGESAEGAMLVVEGQVLIEGSKLLFGPGTLFGQNALFARCERPTSALASSDVTVIVIPRQLMRRVLEASPESAAQLKDALTRQASDLARAVDRVMLPATLG